MNHRRVFIGLTDIAGYYAFLTEELVMLGYEVSFFNAKHNPKTPKAGGKGVKPRTRLMRAILQCQHFYKGTSPIRVLGLLGREVLAPFLLPWAIRNHDVFIFSFAHSFLPFGLDLWILRLFGKRIISNVGHGSDARPSFMDGAYFSQGGVPTTSCELYMHTRLMACALKRVECHSHIVICAPLSAQFLHRPFVNWFFMGIPVSYAQAQNQMNGRKAEGVRILHAPSHLFVKGTQEVRATVAELQAEGYGIDYIEIKGMPHHRVLEELEQCDMVIDQIYSDTPLAGFATEAAYFGRPAVVGGYGFEVLKPFVADDMWPPSKLCAPHELKQAVKALLDDPELREGLGRRAQAFVRKQWSPEAVAARYALLIEDNIPDAWWVDPMAISYVHGGGMSEQSLVATVKSYHERFGPSAFRLGHRPDLVERLLSLVYGKPSA